MLTIIPSLGLSILIVMASQGFGIGSFDKLVRYAQMYLCFRGFVIIVAEKKSNNVAKIVLNLMVSPEALPLATNIPPLGFSDSLI